MTLAEIDTLRLCSLLNTSAFGFVFLLLWRGRTHDNHLLYWSLSSFLYGAVMIGFGLWGEKGIVQATILLMLLAWSNVLAVTGLRHFEGRPVLESWMAAPPLAIGAAHALPILMLDLGWLPSTSLIPRISDVLGLTAAMAINGGMMIAGPLRGQKIAGAAMLAYIPTFLIGLIGEMGVLSGVQSLGVMPLLADQALLAILNLGLLIMPVDQAQADLRTMALRDPLTGVWNRAGLEIEKRRLNAPGAAVIAIDVDHFKTVNDVHGHEVGDAVLQGIAREAARIADAQAGALARIGGDEFILLLPADCGGQRRIAEALLGRCRTGSSSPQPWTLSMGFAQVEAAEENFEAALSRADKALYRAKANGRGRLAA